MCTSRRGPPCSEDTMGVRQGVLWRARRGLRCRAESAEAGCIRTGAPAARPREHAATRRAPGRRTRMRASPTGERQCVERNMQVPKRSNKFRQTFAKKKLGIPKDSSNLENRSGMKRNCNKQQRHPSSRTMAYHRSIKQGLLLLRQLTRRIYKFS